MNYQRTPSYFSGNTCNTCNNTRSPFDRRDDRRSTCQRCTPSCIEDRSLAMVYAPCQHFQNIYEPAEGLSHGTIFRELDKPFMGRKC